MYDYGTYNTTIDSSAVGGLLGAILGFFAIFMIIFLVIALLQVIGTWKILVKGNKPGWGALIPFYNQYLLCEMTGVNPWWILIVLCCGLLAFIPIIGSLLSLAASIYFTILLNVSLARSFGKESGYAVGLILLAPFFYFALGGKNNKYLGANPMDDVVFNKINEKKNGTNQNTQTGSTNTGTNANVKYCPSCGSQITVDTKYCPSCGKEL